MDDDLIFINKQVKFMYGKYYDYILENKYIISDYNTPNDILVEDCFSSNYIYTGHCKERVDMFITLLKKYWKKDKPNYIIKSNWNDKVSFNDFILTHNRMYETIDQVIFMLPNYHSPSEINTTDNIPFKHKLDKLFWRGSTTGFEELINNARYNIVSKNFNIHKDIDIGFSNFCQTAYYNNIDIYQQLYKPNVNINDQLNFKFILNIEGNDWSSSFKWVLASNCCPLHTYPFTYESYIFGNEIIPWIHFVPINKDGSDLVEKYTWCLNNLNKCEQIAYNGKVYMEKYSREDLFDKIMDKFFELYPLITKT